MNLAIYILAIIGVLFTLGKVYKGFCRIKFFLAGFKRVKSTKHFKEIQIKEKC